MTWQTINHVLNQKRIKEDFQIHYREKNRVSFTDLVAIANKFNEYFFNVRPCLAQKVSVR